MADKKKSELIKISIITSVFADLDGLKETGNSVLSQVYPVEWIIIDSDSGSEMRKYLKNLKSAKHKIRWVSEKDRGLYDGMNKGFRLSTGHLVLFLNAADILANENTIKNVIDSYQSDSWTWAVGLAVRINKIGEPRSVWEYYRPTLGGLALGARTFCHQATYYTRELLEQVMPYDVSNLAADHLLNIKAFKISNPKMLTFVTCIFMDGGISSHRPMRAAFKDLRRIRIQENILLLNSRILDWILTYLAIIMIKFGGLAYSALRRLSHGFVQESERLLHSETETNKNLWTDETRRT